MFLSRHPPPHGGQRMDDKRTADEKGVTSEYNTLISILHIEADTVLCMARGVQSLH